MGTLLRDVRFGLRMLLKSPGLTGLVLLTLALGIGANTAIFSLVDAVLFRPLPVADPDRLVRLFTVHEHFSGWSYPGYLDYRDQAQAFSGLAAYGDGTAMHLSRDGHPPERVTGSVVTGNFFEALGVQPEAGRLLAVSDDRAPGSDAVVVLSHELWSGSFGSDPKAIGQTVRINGHPFTIVGVAPRGFFGCSLESFPGLWVPTSMAAAAMPNWIDLRPLERRGFTWMNVVGRLRPEVSIETARAEVDTLAARFAAAPQDGPKITGVRVEPANSVALGFGVEAADRARLVSRLLLGVVALVLLLACADAAGLLLVRAERRGREIAIRRALGATPGCIVRQLLVESVLLAALAAAGGLALASWTLDLVRALAPKGFPVPLEAVAGLGQGRVLLFTLAVSAVAGVTFGLVPALHAARSALLPGLKSEPAAPLLRRWRISLRDSLVLVQVALAAMLLVGAGLLLRTLQQASSVDPGFSTDGRLVASVALGLQGYDRERWAPFYDRLLEEARSLPRVRAAALASSVPVQTEGMGTSVVPEGYPTTPETEPVVPLNIVTPGYFAALGIPVLRGRDFSAADTESAAPVVIVNEAFARAYWQGQEAVGRRIMNLGENGGVVVGLVRDTKLRGLREEPLPAVFVPLAQFYLPTMTLLIHADGDPRAVISSVVAAAQRLDKDLPLFGIQTLTERLGVALAQERLLAVLLGTFAGIALILAAAGLYGVTSYATDLRTREFGIRAALGASPRNVLGLAVRGAVVVSLVGLVAGLLGASALVGSFRSLFFGVGPFDPLTFGGIALLLATVTLIAAALAARRATRVDPLICLRSE